jgi:L-2-hydroxyglutarate oxidase LhgO
VCGKIVVATQPEEVRQLESIYERGLANGLPKIEYIDSKAITEIEPYCVGIRAIWVPYTGIIDFPATCNALARSVQELNPANRVVTQACVKRLERKQGEYAVHTTQGIFRTRHLIACAGLQADRLAWADGLRPDMRIVGFRGDYYDLTPAARHKVRNLIYPVPNPAFPFLGVHFTRMTNGTVECGPNAVFVFKREGYGKTDFSLTDTRQALGYRGTWALFRKHWRFGLDEYRRAFSKRLFCKRLNALMPSLTVRDLTPGRAGVRAQAVDPNGNLVDDFRFAETDNAIHVLNAPSPAATACLAIGSHIVRRAALRFGWE